MNIHIYVNVLFQVAMSVGFNNFMPQIFICYCHKYHGNIYLSRSLTTVLIILKHNFRIARRLSVLWLPLDLNNDIVLNA